MTGISHPGAIRTGAAYYFSSGAVYCRFSGQSGDSEEAIVSGCCGKEVFFSLFLPARLVFACGRRGGNEPVAFSRHPRQVMGVSL